MTAKIKEYVSGYGEHEYVIVQSIPDEYDYRAYIQVQLQKYGKDAYYMKARESEVCCNAERVATLIHGIYAGMYDLYVCTYFDVESYLCDVVYECETDIDAEQYKMIKYIAVEQPWGE